MEEITKDDKTWLIKLRNVATILLIGFALGTIATNITYTKNLMDDCDTMKQFRIGKLAYTCMVK